MKRMAVGTVVAVVIAVVVAGALLGRRLPRDMQLRTGDTKQYSVLAWNLMHSATFSLDRKNPESPAPSSYREPGYPLFLACVLRWQPNVRTSSLEQFLDSSTPTLRTLVYAQRLLHLVTAAMLAGIAFWITRNRWPALAVFVALTVISDLRTWDDVVLSETVITFLLAVCSLLAFTAERRRNPLLHLPVGIALGLLSLTRAVFLYALPVWALFYGVSILFHRPSWRQRSLACGLFLLGFLLTVGPWMIRNKHNFGSFHITQRGGVVLRIRASLDTMTPREYGAAFFYWSNSPTLANLGTRIFGKEATVRLNWKNPEGFYLSARQRRSDLNKEMSPVDADHELLREAKKMVLSHPVAHILLCLPIAVRGLCVEDRFPLSMFLALCSAVFLVYRLSRKDLDVTALWLAPVFSFLFYTGFSHGIPRYNVPLLPHLWLGTVLILFQAAHALMRRFPQKPN